MIRSLPESPSLELQSVHCNALLHDYFLDLDFGRTRKYPDYCSEKLFLTSLMHFLLLLFPQSAHAQFKRGPWFLAMVGNIRNLITACGNFITPSDPKLRTTITYTILGTKAVYSRVMCCLIFVVSLWFVVSQLPHSRGPSQAWGGLYALAELPSDRLLVLIIIWLT